jgi:hypothetical protein
MEWIFSDVVTAAVLATREEEKLKGSTEVGVHTSGEMLELAGEHQSRERGVEQLELAVIH